MKKFVPEFGKVKEKQQLDDNTTVEVERNYQNHNIIGTKLHFEERFRVGSMAEARDKVDELTMRIEKDQYDMMAGPRWCTKDHLMLSLSTQSLPRNRIFPNKHNCDIIQS